MPPKSAKGFVPVQQGALYQRGAGSSVTEIAEVVEIGKDRMGIPHVRFNMHIMHGSSVPSASEQRTLALDIFYARYKDRVHG